MLYLYAYIKQEQILGSNEICYKMVNSSIDEYFSKTKEKIYNGPKRVCFLAGVLLALYE